MKTLKSKLLASAAMLMLSVIMVTSASFAWFTISTAPEITGITTQVVVNDNLEIALDANYTKEDDVNTASTYSSTSLSGNAYTWGNLADLSTARGFSELEKSVRPAMLDDDNKFYYPAYGVDGRINTLAELSQVDKPAITGTNGGEVAFGNLTGESNRVYGYYVDFWVRANKDGDLKLVNSAEGADRGTGETGGGSTFKYTAGTETAAVTAADKAMAANIRVAFQDITSGVTANPVAATTNATKTGETFTGDATFECNKIVTLTANTAKKIRMFVYLDGENMTNADAYLSGSDVAGKLNIQFTMADITTSMNGTTSNGSGSNTQPGSEPAEGN